MTRLVPLTPLLAAAGILLAANGLQGTLIALRADHEGFPTAVIGLVSAAYFAGVMISSWLAPHLIGAVGHIRVFAGLAAIAAVGTLCLVLVIEPLVWAAIRAVMGICFSGLATTIESWLNSRSENADRGRVLSIYRLVDIGAVTGGQFLLPLFPVSGFEIFAVTAILYCLSLVPVCLADRSRPKAPEKARLDLPAIWTISPLACIGCVTIGLTNSAFRLIGPLYAREIGLGVTGIALFVSAGIVGGAILQYPLGYVSDRTDRRYSVLIATGGAMLAGLFLSLYAREPIAVYLGAFAFGAFALPLYSLSAAHANDQASDDDYVLVAAGLSFFFSLGAIVGPFAASLVIETLGAPAFFTYTSVIHGALILVTVYRMSRRAPVPRGARTRFVPLLRTSPVFFRLARRLSRKSR
ncbi:MAG TPA: MFS transporter [Afifellaceae bacterium]|nr:MFS transporter [Afifellaceae bacterium]